MKQVLSFVLLCSVCFSAYSQQGKQLSYLIVRMQAKHDDAAQKYYRIIPEEGNPNSATINSLVKYSIRLKNEGTAIVYTSNPDTTHAFFNYFTSISSALEFLESQGWRLFAIVNDVYGSSGITNTEASYYLRKELP
jgi:hypothetical protein